MSSLIKTNQEIELIKKSCSILSIVKKVVWDAIKIGKTTWEIDQIAYNKIIELGAKPAFKDYAGFPNTICISINEELIHGIPNKNKVIQNGDIVKVDMGVIWKGYYSDSAFTKGVGNISDEDKKIIEVSKGAFYEGLKAIKRNARVGDISNAIGLFVKKQGFFVPREFTGHGIGKYLHEDPSIPNEGPKDQGIKLENNMVICIEPMILQGSNQIKILNDGWTVISTNKKNTAHYEHTILIQNGKGIILTGGI